MRDCVARDKAGWGGLRAAVAGGPGGGPLGGPLSVGFGEIWEDRMIRHPGIRVAQSADCVNNLGAEAAHVISCVPPSPQPAPSSRHPHSGDVCFPCKEMFRLWFLSQHREACAELKHSEDGLHAALGCVFMHVCACFGCTVRFNFLTSCSEKKRFTERGHGRCSLDPRLFSRNTRSTQGHMLP